MKVLLVFGEKLYHYQRQIFEELSELKDLEISFLACNYKDDKLKDSKLLRTINNRFTIYKISPYSSENTFYFFANSEKAEVYDESLFYDFVINFCDADTIKNFKIQFGSVLKTEIKFKHWYAASILENDHTTINLLISADNRNFILFKSLSFSTEMGIYNNRDKALYYLSYLIKSVFNKTNYEVYESDKNDFNFIQNLLYHAKLLRIIFLRQFSKSQLNWKIAVLKNNVPLIITKEAGAFWADPFILKEQDNNWIFFEEFNHQSRLGRITVINLQESSIIEKKSVLEKPYHLSFPNVFKYGESFFMMPEESESQEQNIYKAKKFPFEWEKFKTIFKDMKVVDPVFIFHNQKYWLFFNKIEKFEYENNERLYLYSSADLFSDEWTAHPQNPVIIDKTKARNAGNLRYEQDQLIRVSQNCKTTYGSLITKNRITELSTDIYKEECVFCEWDFDTCEGFHTINSADELTVIDLLVKEEG